MKHFIYLLMFGTKKEYKNNQVSIRLDEEERLFIYQLAKKNNLSVSDYLRNIIFTQILNLENNLNYNGINTNSNINTNTNTNNNVNNSNDNSNTINNNNNEIINSENILSLSNKIQDMFDNTFKSYYLVYKLAQNAFGYEKAKGFIDTAKNRLYSMKSDESNSNMKRNNVNNSSNIDNYVYGNNDYNNNNYNSN